MSEYNMGDSGLYDDYFGDTDSSSFTNSEYEIAKDYADSSKSFNWEDLLSSGSSALGKTLGSLLGLMNKNAYGKDYLEYLKDAKEKELLADLVRSKLTGQKSEKSTSRHAGFGPTASVPSLGSGRSNVTYPYPKASNFQSKLVSYLLGGLKG